MEVDLITATGDGLGPSVLLSLGTRVKGQYLFNVPEGFSRFVLEHKLRPGLGLRAVFCPDLLASTGLPGLLMRLRGEGHGQVELLGPAGTLPYVSSLRHFVHWKHPAVLVTEVQKNPQQQQQQKDKVAPPPLKKQKAVDDEEESQDEYSDEHLSVKCIWVEESSSTTADTLNSQWKQPEWFSEMLKTSSSAAAVNVESINKKVSSDTSNTSTSNSNDSDTSNSTSDSSTSSEDSESSNSDSEEEEDEDNSRDVGAKQKDSSASAMFASLDAAFVKGGSAAGSSRLRTQALGLLKASKPSQTTVGKLNSETQRNSKNKSSDSGRGGRLLSVLAAMEKTAVPSDPNRREVGNRLYTRCEADSISLFSRNEAREPREKRNYRDDTPPSSSSSLVGFLCLIKASHQVLLILHCTTEEQIRGVHAHPAVRAMTHLPLERCDGCIIMLGPGLSHRPPAQHLFSTLQQQEQQPSSEISSPSKSLFILEHPGIGCRGSNLGYISSARMAARLNMVSQRMFPLPIALKSQQQSSNYQSHVQPPPPPPPVVAQKQKEEEEERNDSRFYIQELIKVVWIDGKPVVTSKIDEEEKLKKEEKLSTATTTEATKDEINVGELQTTVHEADPELQISLEQLSESLPFQYRNHLMNFSIRSEAGVDEEKRKEENKMDIDHSKVAMDNNNNNKHAAAVLQAHLRKNTNGTAADMAVQFKPPPPPNPPPPPPPPPPGCPVISHEPEVIFLGTGSAEPSQHRGASAIYLNPGHGHAGFLLDCGEGCYGQLVRFYGPHGAGALISNLSGIWISHRHADHMSGILQILAHYPATAPPLLLIGPHSLHAWLSETTPALGLSHRYAYAHCNEVQQGHHWAFHRICSSLGLLGLSTVPVRHCSDAFGIVLRHCTGWTLVYSGDTEPSEALVRIGTGATLLIHEATFEPLLVSEARKKRHSTSVEAMDVARRMGSYRTVLTHFSQRYPKFPEGVAEAVAAGLERGEGSSVGVAFDGMCLPLGMLPHLPAVTLAVEAVLAAAALASDKEKNVEM